jgi:hypothetical protein
MSKSTAKRLLDSNCSDLEELLDALVSLARDRPYLVQRGDFEGISEADYLLYRLRDRILQIASK